MLIRYAQSCSQKMSFWGASFPGVRAHYEFWFFGHPEVYVLAVAIILQISLGNRRLSAKYFLSCKETWH